MNAYWLGWQESNAKTIVDMYRCVYLYSEEMNDKNDGKNPTKT